MCVKMLSKVGFCYAYVLNFENKLFNTILDKSDYGSILFIKNLKAYHSSDPTSDW